MENPSGWEVKQVMDLIYKNASIKYHEVHVHRLLHRWGLSPKVPQKRFVNIASAQRKRKKSKKNTGYTHKYQKDSP
jgi:transposase